MTETRSTGELVAAAAGADRSAWDALVARYAGLVVGVARRLGLSEADADDVSQTVWLRLVEQLGALREPDALPGWLATTARREGLRLLRDARRQRPSDASDDLDQPADPERSDPAVDLLAAERAQALRGAFAALPESCRRLLTVLAEDPPPSYDEVSRRLEMPIGSIGPTRARCLDKLRRSPLLAPFRAGAGVAVDGG